MTLFDLLHTGVYLGIMIYLNSFGVLLIDARDQGEQSVLKQGYYFPTV